MPNQPTATQIRLNNITACLTVTVDTLDMMANNLKVPFVEVMSTTTRSLLAHVLVSFQASFMAVEPHRRSLGCQAKQEWLCSVAGADLRTAQCNYHCSCTSRYRGRITTNSVESHWEIHRVLAFYKDFLCLWPPLEHYTRSIPSSRPNKIAASSNGF
jgi:hypothetical protein